MKAKLELVGTVQNETRGDFEEAQGGVADAQEKRAGGELGAQYWIAEAMCALNCRLCVVDN